MTEKIIKSFTTISKAVDIDNGVFEAMISTEAVDRQGDIVRALGARLENYLKNPVVLWAHDYQAPPVARALSVEIIPGEGLKSTFQFSGWGVNPQADTIRRLWAGGFLNATSIGFIPLKSNPMDGNKDGEGWYSPHDYVEWELLEFSIVPVPANQDALRLALRSLAQPVAKRGRVLSAVNERKLREAAEAINAVLEQLADETQEEGIKTAVPYADHGADEESEWSKPALGDFTDQAWEDLTDTDKRRIMAHYAWTASNPPETFGDLKLPHHKAGTSGVGAAVWRGVAAAMAALLGGRGGVDMPESDRKSVYNHLSRHYAQFDREPPDYKELDPGDNPVTESMQQESNINLTPNDMATSAIDEAVLDAFSHYFDALLGV